MTDTVQVKIEFGGGTELLLAPPHLKKHTVNLPRKTEAGEQSNVTYLIDWIRRNLIAEREEFFIDGNSVRPGILVLINNGDWELEGEGDYVLQSGDEVVFISTLHGG